jgi:hypothetical protein
VAVIVADPLPWAVRLPSLLTISTRWLSDCQFVHVLVTSREVPFERVSVAVAWAVWPVLFNPARLADSVTALVVDGVEGVAQAAPRADRAAMRPRAIRFQIIIGFPVTGVGTHAERPRQSTVAKSFDATGEERVRRS